MIHRIVSSLPLPFELKVALYFALATPLLVLALPVLASLTVASILWEGAKRSWREAQYTWIEHVRPCLNTYATGWKDMR